EDVEMDPHSPAARTAAAGPAGPAPQLGSTPGPARALRAPGSRRCPAPGAHPAGALPAVAGAALAKGDTRGTAGPGRLAYRERTRPHGRRMGAVCARVAAAGRPPAGGARPLPGPPGGTAREAADRLQPRLHQLALRTGVQRAGGAAAGAALADGGVRPRLV